MMKPIALVGAWVALFVGTVLAARSGAFDQAVEPRARSLPASVPAMAPSSAAPYQPGQGFIYGRVTTHDGATYEGRLRFGGGEEAFWGDQFNGVKDGNPWVAYVPLDQRSERRALEVFGFEIAVSEGRMDLSRPFMARFGDLVRIERNGSEIRVTLKTGTVFHLDRYAADDFADGLRIWDGARGIVDLEESQVRSIDLLPTARLDAAPERLHGTVLTAAGSFTGIIQWDREKGVGSDELEGLSGSRETRLRFDDIRSIARDSRNSSLVTLLDGREIVLSGTRNVAEGNRGVYVDDRRYGRVLVPWEVFERIDFSAGGASPAYGDFPLGGRLTGTVTTHDGRRLSGRLVYDLDESETTETLDAPSQGVDYTLLFGLIASIVLPAPDEPQSEPANAILHSGEQLRLDRAGDLGGQNAGMLIFVDDPARPEYLRWDEVRRVDFDTPTAFPTVGTG